ncbi:MAG: thiamine pyrophosphate-binding protein, partial [Candidatus Omnitrophica bacterium]|nr:thiamine pyrophosphate-binding protein [Candidatus Omnitrophota bacterium]
GVAASWIDSIPVLIISGQVKRSDMILEKRVRQMGPQEVDVVSLVKPITKYAVTVMDPDQIKYHLDKAVYLAKEGRPGPVWIDIPLDVQGANIDEKKLKGFKAPLRKPLPKEIDRKFERLVKLINEAQRPVILAGNGIRLAGGVENFKELVRKLGIPVLTTWKAIDFFPEDDPLYVGRPGAIGQRGANFAQQNADLIICVGARLDTGQVAFNYKNFARAAKKVIVDVDEHEIRKIDAKVDLAFKIDAGLFLEGLERKVSMIHIDTENWLKKCQSWKVRYPVILEEYKVKKGWVNTYALVDILAGLLTSDDLIIPGSSGTCSEITLQAFRIKEGQRIFNSPGLGSMGFGIPASIGACIASGKKRTVCLIGDGGFQHNIQELELLRRYDLPIKLFVSNNNAYASIRTTQNRFFNGHRVACDPASGLTLPDTLKVAKAYGLRTFRIHTQKNLKEKVLEVLNFSGPAICEVMINPDLMIQPRVSNEVKPDGKIVSKPMEDLWPFLTREEFKENMAVSPCVD